MAHVDWEKIERRRAEVRPGFDQWQRFLDLRNGGYGVPAFDRLREASVAIRKYRDANNYRGRDYEQLCLAVRVVADTLANEIEAAADGQDPATVAWVLAGLRCPARPFCTGCRGCVTVTSPERSSG